MKVILLTKLIILVFVQVAITSCYPAQSQEQIAPWLNEESVMWSPNGQYIVFSAYLNDNAEVYLVNPTDMTYRNITNRSGRDNFWLGMSPNGNQIGINFLKEDSTGGFDIFVYDIETNELFDLIVTEDDERLPLWSPDGSRIAFLSDLTGIRQLYFLESDNQLKQITNENRHVTQMVWSPDGKQMVYSVQNMEQSGLSDLFIIDLSNKEKNLLTDKIPCLILSGWLFNDQEIIYNACYNDKLDFWIASTSDGAIRSLNASPSSYAPYARLSPNRDSILFTSQQGKSDEIYILGLTDGKKRQLTNTPELNEYYPFWSPDGKQVGYWTDNFELGELKLHIIDVNGDDDHHQELVFKSR